MDDDLIINGNEPNYYEAYQAGHIYFDIPEDGYPMIDRVARQMVCINYLAQSYTEARPENAIVIEGVGGYDDLVSAGLENLLKPLN